MARPSRLTLRWFAPQTDLSHRRILLSTGSALIAVGLATLVSQLSLSGSDVPVMVASIGASAVLLFIIPSSTLSTPWAFAGGHLVSTIIGVSCARWIPELSLAAALAVSLSILAMFYLRCLHPPGGAIALLAVLGGESVQSLGYQFVLTPVMVNVAVMLALAMIYWRLAGLARPDPGGADNWGLDHNWQRSNEEWLAGEIPFSPDDLAHAMAEMDTYLDISHHDLGEIYSRALQRSHTHALCGICCCDAMSQPAIYVEYGTELEETWQLFERHRIRGLPVVDAFQRVLGIVTVSDFVHMASEAAEDGQQPGEPHNIAERLAWLRRRTPGFESNKPEVAGQLMSSPVITAGIHDHIADLVPLFTQHNIHHLPVVDDSRRLVGMLTREDVMAARAGDCCKPTEA